MSNVAKTIEQPRALMFIFSSKDGAHNFMSAMRRKVKDAFNPYPTSGSPFTRDLCRVMLLTHGQLPDDAILLHEAKVVAEKHGGYFEPYNNF